MLDRYYFGIGSVILEFHILMFIQQFALKLNYYSIVLVKLCQALSIISFLIVLYGMFNIYKQAHI